MRHRRFAAKKPNRRCKAKPARSCQRTSTKRAQALRQETNTSTSTSPIPSETLRPCGRCGVNGLTTTDGYRNSLHRYLHFHRRAMPLARPPGRRVSSNSSSPGSNSWSGAWYRCTSGGPNQPGSGRSTPPTSRCMGQSDGNADRTRDYRRSRSADGPDVTNQPVERLCGAISSNTAPH